MTEPRKPKRLVFCFDGTWNRLAADCPTNVVRIAQMIEPTARDGTPQLVYYDEGIGTENKLTKLMRGALGHGMMQIIAEAYRFLIFNYAPGDEIFAFGFSRGAYTARSFAGFIRHAGILDAVSASQIEKAIEIYRKAPAKMRGMESLDGLKFREAHCTGICVSEDDRAYRIATFASGDGKGSHPAGYDPASLPILDIRFVGVWDTVRALGIPEFIPGSAWFNRRYAFHDAVLTSKVKSARHAVAIDEPRVTFRPTLLGRDKVRELNGFEQTKRSNERRPPLDDWELPYQERWFPGVHGAVGGGGSRRGLSDEALAWVLWGARAAGLDIRTSDTSPVYSLTRNPLDELRNESARGIADRPPLIWLRRLFQRPRKGPASLDELALAALRRWYAAPGELPGARPYRPRTLADAAQAIAAWPFAPGQLAAAPLAEHTVQRGDTLHKLARQHFGDAARWREIFAANRDRIDNPDDIAIGMTLRIPGAPPPPAA